jgi:poly(glycerol-phosphate) alpha-glucosyltransferase
MSSPLPSIIHVTSWLSRQGGGIPPVIWSLASHIRKAGVECSVAGLEDQWSPQDIPGSIPTVSGAIKGSSAFGFSPELSAQLRRLAHPGSVVHVHGLWMYPGIAGRKLAQRVAGPLVISPHGMLEPWALKNSSWKKSLAARLFEDKNLRSANCLHALCQPEAENFRRYGLRNPIAVIPNGIDVSEIHPLPDRDALAARIPEIRNRRRVLFLSRLHPKNGLENLLLAWRTLISDFPDWCLLIAGSGLPEYEHQLRAIVQTSGMNANVFFLGPVHGQEKQQALASADLFVLPSFSEGFSMAILEAAAAGLPVVLTRECNFTGLAAAGGAIEVAAEIKGTAEGLRQVMRLSDGERKSMGQRGKELIERDYTWDVKTRQILELYGWLSGGGHRPEFVRLN